MFIWGLVGFVLVLVVTAYGLRFLYDYRLEDHGIVVVAFGRLALTTFRFVDMDDIRVVRWFELGIGGTLLRLGNRVGGTCVLLTMKTGLFRRIVITPSDAVSFAARARMRIGASSR